MSPIYLIKYYFKEFKFWLKRKIQGDVRPEAVKKPATKKRTTTRKKKNDTK